MYQNSLHELIDASKKMKVFPHVGIPLESESMARALVMALPKLGADAVCFYAEVESVPEIDIKDELVRLPFQSCWVEFDCGDGVRTCFLCTEHRDEILVVHFVKNLDGVWLFRGVYKIEKLAGGQCSMGVVGDVGDTERYSLKTLFRYLTALNCCNITRAEHKPKPSQQSVRRALGRQPLFSTWTLEIDLDRTERELPGESCGGHTSKRLHLCRGHARQHKPGQWCWVRAHVRGDKSVGMIHKDYASH